MSLSSLGKQAILDQVINKRLFALLSHDIEKEMAVMCAQDTSSIMNTCSMDTLIVFGWDVLAADLREEFPLSFIQS